MDIRKRLKELLGRSGLTDEEINFYLTNLKNPRSSIYQLSRKSKIPKDRAYKICESLEEKNLIKISKNGKAKKINTESLNNFISNLNSKGRRLHRTADALEEINPFLPLFGSTEESCIFKSFRSEGAGEAFVDISLFKWDYVLAYGDFDSVMPAITETCDQQFVKNRIRRGKKCLPVIINPGEYTFDKLIKRDRKEIRETKVIYNEKFSNYFVTLAPDVNIVCFWLRDEDGNVKGAMVENPLLTKVHENIYKHFEGISKPHSFRGSEETGN